MRVDDGGVEDISQVGRAVGEVYGEVVAAGHGVRGREAEVDVSVAVDTVADRHGVELGGVARGHAAREVCCRAVSHEGAMLVVGVSGRGRGREHSSSNSSSDLKLFQV